jgi:hypothetical protein
VWEERTELHSGTRRIYINQRMQGTRREGILPVFRRTMNTARLLSPGGVRVLRKCLRDCVRSHHDRPKRLVMRRIIASRIMAVEELTRRS